MKSNSNLSFYLLLIAALLLLTVNGMQYRKNTRLVNKLGETTSEYADYRKHMRVYAKGIAQEFVADKLLLDAYRRTCYGTVPGK